jgi:hypothetical protein
MYCFPFPGSKWICQVRHRQEGSRVFGVPTNRW